MNSLSFNKWRFLTYGRVIGWSLVLYNFTHFLICLCLLSIRPELAVYKNTAIVAMLIASIVFIFKYPPSKKWPWLYRVWLAFNIVLLNSAILYTEHKYGHFDQNVGTMSMLLMGAFTTALYSTKLVYSICLLSMYAFDLGFSYWFHTSIPTQVFTTITPVALGSFMFKYIFDKSLKVSYQYSQAIQLQAITDPLTGLYTRQFLTETIILNERMRFSGVAIMLDIDKFKTINDTYGHATGDKVLINFASLLKASVRSTDYYIRFGGEEFILFLPNTTVDQGKIIAEALRKKCESDMLAPKFTISCGVSEFSEGERFEKVVARVDANLYRAKNSGRNCVV